MKSLFVDNKSGVLTETGNRLNYNTRELLRPLLAMFDKEPDLDIHHAEFVVLQAVGDLFLSYKINNLLRKE